jgi:hypothetical protein
LLWPFIPLIGYVAYDEGITSNLSNLLLLSYLACQPNLTSPYLNQSNLSFESGHTHVVVVLSPGENRRDSRAGDSRRREDRGRSSGQERLGQRARPLRPLAVAQKRHGQPRGHHAVARRQLPGSHRRQR